MVRTATIVWHGISGQSYEYELRPIGSTLPKAPGNYVLCRRLENGRYSAIYAGETSDLSERFDDHHAMPCIKRRGATHISYRVHYGGKDARQMEEKDIRARYNPPCNG